MVNLQHVDIEEYIKHIKLEIYIKSKIFKKLRKPTVFYGYDILVYKWLLVNLIHYIVIFFFSNYLEVLIIGDSSVGKSCLLLQFSDQTFSDVRFFFFLIL